jgi:hypothetical protein
LIRRHPSKPSDHSLVGGGCPPLTPRARDQQPPKEAGAGWPTHGQEAEPIPSDDEAPTSSVAWSLHCRVIEARSRQGSGEQSSEKLRILPLSPLDRPSLIPP